MAREHEGTGLAHDAKYRHIVTALVAAIEELARGIEIETAGIVTPRPLFADERQLAGRADREYSNAIVQAVADVYKSAIAGNQDFRSKIAAREVRRQAGERLAGSQPTVGAIIVEQHD